MQQTPVSPLVLVVDDDRDTRELYRVIFDMAGCRTIEAPTVAEAVRLCREERPQVALCDWRLPDGDGLDLAARLQAGTPARPPALVAITGVTMAADALRDAQAAGFVRVMQKPVAPDQIVQVVGELTGAAAGPL